MQSSKNIKNSVKTFARSSRIKLLAFNVALLISSQVYAVTYESTGTTSVFSDLTTWKMPSGFCAGTTLASGSGALTTSDDVYICTSTTVTLGAAASIRDVYLKGGTLALGNFDLTVTGLIRSQATASSITSSGGSLVLTDADHTLNLWNNTSAGMTVPKLTLPNPTANRTITFNDGATITALSATPTTSAGKGLIFSCAAPIAKTITFPAGTTIDYCSFPATGNCTFTNLTCTNPPGTLPSAPVSASILTLEKHPVTFATEVEVK